MTTLHPTTDEALRDLVTRGELSHLSIAPSQGGKMFRASFAMCSKYGVSVAEDADPVKAILLAVSTAKMAPRPRATPKPTIDGEATRVEPEKAFDPADDLM